MNHVLLADDDIELTEMLREYLEVEGFRVSLANDGEEALAAATQEGIDVVVLDVMMPKMNGFDVLRELRVVSQVPVLMLTARGDDVDSIVGLELGADDYLSKPCNPRVLVARIRATLRRMDSLVDDPVVAANKILKVGDLTLNTGTRTVYLDEQIVDMTSTEFSLLWSLLRAAGKVVTKETLSEDVLGRKLGRYDRSIDMHMSNLRKKLGPLTDGEARMKTVRGVGYQYISI